MSPTRNLCQRFLSLIGLIWLAAGVARAQENMAASPREALEVRRYNLERQLANLSPTLPPAGGAASRSAAVRVPGRPTAAGAVADILRSYVQPPPGAARARAGGAAGLTVRMQSRQTHLPGKEINLTDMANLLAQQLHERPAASQIETKREFEIESIEIRGNRAIIKVRYALLFKDPEDASDPRWHDSFRDSRGMRQTARGRATETWELTRGASERDPENWTLVGSEQRSEPRAPVSLSQECEPDYWEQYLLGLEFHPIGFARVHIGPENLMEQLSGNLIRMHPAGFAADHYCMYVGPTAGQRNGREWTPLFVTGAQELGRSATRIYYGFGLQQQLTPMRHSSSALSVGGYGYWGPHQHRGGTVYLVGTQRLWHGRGDEARALFGHLGVKLETYHLETDGTGIRPFIGLNAAPFRGRRFYLSAEFSPRQPWERAHQYALRGKFVLGGLQLGGAKVRAMLSIGLQNNGYRTRPVLGIGF